MHNSNQSILTTLHRLLTRHFDREDLHTLTFDLGIVYDDLRGEGRASKARELVLLMARQGRLPELVELARSYRSNADWPSVPEDIDLEAMLDSQEMSTASARTPPGPTFNISGDIHAGQVNIGGAQAFTGPVEVDMRETTISQLGEVVTGDRIEMPGDFWEALVNVKSRLDSVSQTIRTLPHVDNFYKQELVRLIDDLTKQLEQAPEDRIEDAEKVSKRMEALAGEIDSEKPDKEMVEITGESLKRAAQNLADVLPTVLTIATRIVSHVMRSVM
jgi:hypothetical protein